MRLRKALSTMNDLEPPRDDLFAQRALMRGRARTSRRRSTLLGAAAALVVVGAVGGSWMALSQGGGSASSASAGSAPEVMKDATGSAGADNGARGPATLSGSEAPTGVDLVPSAPPARDSTRWFGTLSTLQTNAFDAVEPTVAARWPDVFSGRTPPMPQAPAWPSSSPGTTPTSRPSWPPRCRHRPMWSSSS